MAKPLRYAFDRCYMLLVQDHRCDAYVKTIYVGFSIRGEMVAAFYPRSDCIEIALALPENAEGDEFKDATHLTWPTMQVCLEVRTEADVTLAIEHLATAAMRVASGQHGVRRPNEDFIGRVKRGISRPKAGPVET
jgi:hypothetical protein